VAVLPELACVTEAHMWDLVGLGVITALAILFLFWLGGRKSALPPEGHKPIKPAPIKPAPLPVPPIAIPKSAAENDHVQDYDLKIFFGSQTGTAEGFSFTLRDESKALGLTSVVIDLEKYNTVRPLVMAANQSCITLIRPEFSASFLQSTC
jgi:hypothetical protein